MISGIFEGLRVIELAGVLAGPATGEFFAELGAEVIKIENPGTGGDITRKWKLPEEPADNPVSAYYCSVNALKKIISLDLTAKPDYQALLALLEKADILIANFKPGDAEKLGVDYAFLSAKFPALVYAHITGYGETDPRPAFDLVLQAESGFMSMNGTTESGPLKMPVALIDLLAAHQLKEGILCALLRKQRTGNGAYINVTLADAAISALANQATNYLMAGKVPGPEGSLHPNIAPYGETVRCKDGKYIVLAVGNDTQFTSLCNMVGQARLARDSRFSTNERRVVHRKELLSILKDFFLGMNSLELLEMMNTAGVPAGRVRSLDEVFSDEPGRSLIREGYVDGQKARWVKNTCFTMRTND